MGYLEDVEVPRASDTCDQRIFSSLQLVTRPEFVHIHAKNAQKRISAVAGLMGHCLNGK